MRTRSSAYRRWEMPSWQDGIGHLREGELRREERSLMNRLNSIGEAGHPYRKPHV